MFRGSDVLGSEIRIDDAAMEQRVCGWVIDADNNRLLALIVAQGGWVGGAKILLWDHVMRIEPATVHVDPAGCVIDIGKVMQVKAALEQRMPFLDLLVIGVDGERLGEIEDLYFDASGLIKGIRVLQDMRGSEALYQYVVVDGRLRVVDGTVIIEEAPHRSDGGTGNIAGQEDISQSLRAASGHRPQDDVRDSDQRILVAAEQIITPEIMLRIQAIGEEQTLLNALNLP